MTARDRRLRRRYDGLTSRQWDKMFKVQGGRCKICREPGCKGKSHMRGRVKVRRLFTDHDHKTKRVRGLICFRCNHRLLGRGLEDPALHVAAAAYLRSSFDGRRI